MGFRAILFDLDGTLVDTERESIIALDRVLERNLQISITRQDRDFVVGRSWRAIYQQLRAAHPALTWSEPELIAAVAVEREVVLAESGMTILPGSRACIERFADLGRALVTGSSRAEVQHVMAIADWGRAFEVVVAAEDVAHSKPAPDGYLAAAEALGVPPEACLVVEDSSPGIAAGIAAGATVVAVRAGNFLGHDQSAAHRVIDSLDQLTSDLLTSLAGR